MTALPGRLHKERNRSSQTSGRFGHCIQAIVYCGRNAATMRRQASYLDVRDGQGDGLGFLFAIVFDV